LFVRDNEEMRREAEKKYLASTFRPKLARRNRASTVWSCPFT